MLHDLLLAVLIVLISFLYVKFAKLTKAIDGLYKDFEFSLDCIDKKLKEINSDIANSTAKLQDRICGVHESIENCHKEIVDLTKKSFEGIVENMKLVEELNTDSTRNIVSTATKDINSNLADIHEVVATLKDRLDAHNNYVIAHNKETRPLLSELLEAIQASKTSESKDTPAENTNEVKRPKTAIRRNKRKYTKDTEEVKE